MKKRIILTLDFDERDLLADCCLFDAAVFLNGINYEFVFDCVSAEISVLGLSSDLQKTLANRLKKIKW